MKLDLSIIDPEYFYMIPTVIAGEECVLIHPKPHFFDWTEELLTFRSSMWNSEGELISASFKKFFNFEEKPTITPFDDSKGLTAIDKLDGSTLVVSRYKGELILRTRGSVDYSKMPSANDIPGFLERYRKFFDSDMEGLTYLFEWTSPDQKIVLDYGATPQLHLLAVVNHKDYSMMSQSDVDMQAKLFGLKRPIRFLFDSVGALIDHIQGKTDIEGVCLYYNHDQNIRKIKSLHYLKLHRFKSELNVKNMIALFGEWGCPGRAAFLENVEKQFDFECRTAAENVCDQFFPVADKLLLDIESMRGFVDANAELIQKDFALKVQSDFPKHLHGYAFKLRQGANIASDNIVKTLLALTEEAA